jgi:uncharacterized protein with PCYCGC motif
MKRMVVVLYFSLIMAMLVAACGGAPAPKATLNAMPDVQFPEFVYASEMSLKAYRLAMQMPIDWLRSLPCYCNCGPTLGHRSLYDCFIKADGSFNDHASTCAVCDLEVTDAAKWLTEGQSLKQVRQLIDRNYATYGEGTHTRAVH